MIKQILDVTLRDGGYVNNHDFSEDEAYGIVKGLQEASIDYIEVGYYRPQQAFSKTSKTGAAVCGLDYVTKLSSIVGNSKLVVMVHPNQVAIKDYEILKHHGISLVRLATKPEYINGIEHHIEAIKNLEMCCSVNLIRVSEIPLRIVLSCGQRAEAMGADWFYVADSNGNLFPHQVSKIIRELSENLTIKMGFHAHDGLRLAFANAIAALNAGAQVVDSSLGGMGKSGGNLITELIATYMNWSDRTFYNISRLSRTTYKYLNKWVGTQGIVKCESAIASIQNMNIDSINVLKSFSQKQQIPLLELMEMKLCDVVAIGKLSTEGVISNGDIRTERVMSNSTFKKAKLATFEVL